MNFIYCNAFCGRTKSLCPRIKFLLTECTHVVCQDCYRKANGRGCPVCKKQSKVVELSNKCAAASLYFSKPCDQLKRAKERAKICSKFQKKQVKGFKRLTMFQRSRLRKKLALKNQRKNALTEAAEEIAALQREKHTLEEGIQQPKTEERESTGTHNGPRFPNFPETPGPGNLCFITPGRVPGIDIDVEDDSVGNHGASESNIRGAPLQNDTRNQSTVLQPRKDSHHNSNTILEGNCDRRAAAGSAFNRQTHIPHPSQRPSISARGPSQQPGNSQSGRSNVNGQPTMPRREANTHQNLQAAQGRQLGGLNMRPAPGQGPQTLACRSVPNGGGQVERNLNGRQQPPQNASVDISIMYERQPGSGRNVNNAQNNNSDLQGGMVRGANGVGGNLAARIHQKQQLRGAAHNPAMVRRANGVIGNPAIRGTQDQQPRGAAQIPAMVREANRVGGNPANRGSQNQQTRSEAHISGMRQPTATSSSMNGMRTTTNVSSIPRPNPSGTSSTVNGRGQLAQSHRYSLGSLPGNNLTSQGSSAVPHQSKPGPSMASARSVPPNGMNQFMRNSTANPALSHPRNQLMEKRTAPSMPPPSQPPISYFAVVNPEKAAAAGVDEAAQYLHCRRASEVSRSVGPSARTSADIRSGRNQPPAGMAREVRYSSVSSINHRGIRPSQAESGSASILGQLYGRSNW